MKKAFLLLILLELAVVFIFGVLDPFHVGIEYMGEGLPLLFSILLSWILVFKIWTLYCVLFVITPSAGHQRDWKVILFLLLVTNILLFLGDQFFIEIKEHLYLLMISFASTTLVFDVWVFWKGWVNRKEVDKLDFLRKCSTLLLIELTTLVVSLLIGDRIDSYILIQLFLSVIIAASWMLNDLFRINAKKEKG
jgi:hypothetical protein